MATSFKNSIVKDIGTQPVEVLATTPSTRSTVIGLSITNLTDSFVFVSVLIEDDTSVTGFYLKDALLAANTSLRAVSTGEKLILEPSNKLLVQSSRDDSIDVVVSHVEVT